MNRKNYRLARGKRAALALCSLLLSFSGCGCSGTHEHCAMLVNCVESFCAAHDHIGADGSARDDKTAG